MRPPKAYVEIRVLKDYVTELDSRALAFHTLNQVNTSDALRRCITDIKRLISTARIASFQQQQQIDEAQREAAPAARRAVRSILRTLPAEEPTRGYQLHGALLIIEAAELDINDFNDVLAEQNLLDD